MKFIILLLCLLKYTHSNSVIGSRFWTLTCDKCTNALNDAIDRNCYGQKACTAVINNKYPQCYGCINQLLDENNFEIVNGNKYLVCVKQNELQAIGCTFYCRINFFEKGECVKENKMPICKCFDSEVEASSTTATNSPVTTATTEAITEATTEETAGATTEETTDATTEASTEESPEATSETTTEATIEETTIKTTEETTGEITEETTKETTEATTKTTISTQITTASSIEKQCDSGWTRIGNLCYNLAQGIASNAHRILPSEITGICKRENAKLSTTNTTEIWNYLLHNVDTYQRAYIDAFYDSHTKKYISSDKTWIPSHNICFEFNLNTPFAPFMPCVSYAALGRCILPSVCNMHQQFLCSYQP